MIFADLKRIDFHGLSNKYEAQLKMLEPSYYLQVSLSIGERGSPGADYFDVDIFSINYIQKDIKKEHFFVGANSIIVDDIDDIDDLEDELRNLVNSIYGDTWEDVLKKLREYFKWEYENYNLVENK